MTMNLILIKSVSLPIRQNSYIIECNVFAHEIFILLDIKNPKYVYCISSKYLVSSVIQLFN